MVPLNITLNLTLVLTLTLTLNLILTLTAQNIKIRDKFLTTSQVDRKYLQKKRKYCRTENGVANCNLSCACTLNLVNYGPQMAKKHRSF